MDAHLGNHDLRRGGKPLGIMAPAAAQRAALEKHGIANAGAVVHGKFFQIKDLSRQRLPSFSLNPRIVNVNNAENILP